MAEQIGLRRCGKSCRLRWLNYLSPEVKRAILLRKKKILSLDSIIPLETGFSSIAAHLPLFCNWSLIAKRVPGRTDNQAKNYWNTHLTKNLAGKDENGRLSIKHQSSRVAVSSSAISKLQDLVKAQQSLIKITVDIGFQKAFKSQMHMNWPSRIVMQVLSGFMMILQSSLQLGMSSGGYPFNLA
ncbi:hypothetical protein GH714_010385 [Hevea brasiliensis]|uniref:HTH myb-type domain-containing protein n=1 Tax=Hevea brasiliensis TaxID=3981 RepID=A0A6A6M7Y8_HEVBR|nr:hypothetical protein GH714_010385 [Hevea brasiliensis]